MKKLWLVKIKITSLIILHKLKYLTLFFNFKRKAVEEANFLKSNIAIMTEEFKDLKNKYSKDTKELKAKLEEG